MIRPNKSQAKFFQNRRTGRKLDPYVTFNPTKLFRSSPGGSKNTTFKRVSNQKRELVRRRYRRKLRQLGHFVEASLGRRRSHEAKVRFLFWLSAQRPHIYVRRRSFTTIQQLRDRKRSLSSNQRRKLRIRRRRTAQRLVQRLRRTRRFRRFYSFIHLYLPHLFEKCPNRRKPRNSRIRRYLRNLRIRRRRTAQRLVQRYLRRCGRSKLHRWLLRWRSAHPGRPLLPKGGPMVKLKMLRLRRRRSLMFAHRLVRRRFRKLKRARRTKKQRRRLVRRRFRKLKRARRTKSRPRRFSIRKFLDRARSHTRKMLRRRSRRRALRKKSMEEEEEEEYPGDFEDPRKSGFRRQWYSVIRRLKPAARTRVDKIFYRMYRKGGRRKLIRLRTKTPAVENLEAYAQDVASLGKVKGRPISFNRTFNLYIPRRLSRLQRLRLLRSADQEFASEVLELDLHYRHLRSLAEPVRPLARSRRLFALRAALYRRTILQRAPLRKRWLRVRVLGKRYSALRRGFRILRRFRQKPVGKRSFFRHLRAIRKRFFRPHVPKSRPSRKLKVDEESLELEVSTPRSPRLARLRLANDIARRRRPFKRAYRRILFEFRNGPQRARDRRLARRRIGFVSRRERRFYRKLVQLYRSRRRRFLAVRLERLSRSQRASEDRLRQRVKRWRRRRRYLDLIRRIYARRRRRLLCWHRRVSRLQGILADKRAFSKKGSSSGSRKFGRVFRFVVLRSQRPQFRVVRALGLPNAFYRRFTGWVGSRFRRTKRIPLRDLSFYRPFRFWSKFVSPENWYRRSQVLHRKVFFDRQVRRTKSKRWSLSSSKPWALRSGFIPKSYFLARRQLGLLVRSRLLRRPAQKFFYPWAYTRQRTNRPMLWRKSLTTRRPARRGPLVRFFSSFDRKYFTRPVDRTVFGYRRRLRYRRPPGSVLQFRRRLFGYHTSVIYRSRVGGRRQKRFLLPTHRPTLSRGRKLRITAATISRRHSRGFPRAFYRIGRFSYSATPLVTRHAFSRPQRARFLYRAVKNRLHSSQFVRTKIKTVRIRRKRRRRVRRRRSRFAVNVARRPYRYLRVRSYRLSARRRSHILSHRIFKFVPELRKVSLPILTPYAKRLRLRAIRRLYTRIYGSVVAASTFSPHEAEERRRRRRAQLTYFHTNRILRRRLPFKARWRRPFHSRVGRASVRFIRVRRRRYASLRRRFRIRLRRKRIRWLRRKLYRFRRRRHRMRHVVRWETLQRIARRKLEGKKPRRRKNPLTRRQRRIRRLRRRRFFKALRRSGRRKRPKRVRPRRNLTRRQLRNITRMRYRRRRKRIRRIHRRRLWRKRLYRWRPTALKSRFMVYFYMRQVTNNFFYSIFYRRRLVATFSNGRTEFVGSRRTSAVACESAAKRISLMLRANKVRAIFFVFDTRLNYFKRAVIRVLRARRFRIAGFKYYRRKPHGFRPRKRASRRV